MQKRTQPSLYQDELAHIHATHFQDFVKNAATFITSLVAEKNIPKGRAVDLGCGNGTLLKALAKKGYKPYGLDVSPTLIKLAKKTLPKADFHCGSFFDNFKCPSATLVTSISECLSYLGNLTPSAHRKKLGALFSKVYKALEPGGLFIFDMVEPTYVAKNPPRLRKYETKDFTLISELLPSQKTPNSFTRDITFFIKKGKHYIRHHEAHTMITYQKSDILKMLRSQGFKATTASGYVDFKLRPAQTAYIATKP